MPEILIAGAGIGGLAAALGLARNGIAVTLLERARRLEEVGVGLQISPNATRVLAKLGVLDALAARASRPSGIHVRSARSGATLASMPLADAERRWGAPYLVARRAVLQDVLARAVAAEPAIALHLDTTLAGFGTTSAGVTATVKQGRLTRSFVADALIGADGHRSTVRQRLVDREDAPRETGRAAWRALIPAQSVAPEFTTEETNLWLGRDAHLVHYRLDDGTSGDGALVNVVAVTREAPAGAPADLWSTPGDPAIVRARFAKWHRSARRLVDAAPAWTRWPLFDRDPLASWSAGPVALLGDAAHPILPFLAQGSAQAIEDADALAAAVAATRDLTAAFARYSAARTARAARVQDMSRRLGRIYHLAGPAALARDLGLRTMGGGRLLARYDWLYGLKLQKT